MFKLNKEEEALLTTSWKYSIGGYKWDITHDTAETTYGEQCNLQLINWEKEEMIKKLGRKLTVKECRENAGLTIEKMAKRMNISEVSYLTIEETGIFRNSIHMCYFSDLVDVSMSDVEHELKLLSLPIK